MEEDRHEYRGTDITVVYDSNRCIHVRECVEGLSDVFDVSRRPWVLPDAADADEVAAVVERCPTGALHYERSDGSPEEQVPAKNTVRATPNGPLYVRGNVVVTVPDGATLEDTRVGLCRCGHSMNKPLCDNSHQRVFDADGGNEEMWDVPAERAEDTDTTPETLTVTARPNGPFHLEGPFELARGDGRISNHDEAVLCRCGGSENKPFCDGAHAEIGFSSDD
ncbi:CDGSH iron-sulfur domain-containing protein [Halogeometricum limi]|uniref:Uncharacterized Fe-S cluster protein YjdI n=1 Tax=Halogeometricum limi TaxID=555875 RepID=A0A1I6G0N4_9EURY|nr:CDGSH iron-sulfur domain-containing protein [Halogeometricum limi]SFR35617.1 Uncharacterized Fe-S cluster protein YjdI [Halogeometricum limi]